MKANKFLDFISYNPEIDLNSFEVYTSDDVIAMLTDTKDEILEMKSYESSDGQDLAMLADIGILFQQKIDKLKGENNHE